MLVPAQKIQGLVPKNVYFSLTNYFSEIMTRILSFICLSGFLLGLSSCHQTPETASSCFPDVRDPKALTHGPMEHLFASYYGINSWSKNQRFATVLETDIRDTIPTEHEAAVLGLVDMESLDFLPLTTTKAWNFQQGCMAHWLGTSPDSLIIYNDLEEGRFVSRIMNVFTQKILKTFPHPVSAVSPDGKKAISINFARLRLTRPDYGYGGEGQDARAENPFPEDDGLFLLDLESGEIRLLVSIADVKNMVREVPDGGMEYFNHTLFSRDGSKIFWLARATPQRNTVSMCVNTDGSQLLTCFPDGWGGSHFDWLDGEKLMVTAAYKGLSFGHILFTPGEDDYHRLGNGILDYDGHGTFSPDQQWMITDTYPEGRLREQKLYLMNMESEAVLPLGRFVEPKEFRERSGGSRCDLHPRWSPEGNMIGFNSTNSGSRQCYMIELRF
jgi:hypothetical protein